DRCLHPSRMYRVIPAETNGRSPILNGVDAGWGELNQVEIELPVQGQGEFGQPARRPFLYSIVPPKTDRHPVNRCSMNGRFNSFPFAHWFHSAVSPPSTGKA